MPARCSTICRSRSVISIDDEKASAAVKALYATGFFRDVRLEAEGRRAGRHRPGAADDQPDRYRRHQGVREGHAEEGAQGHRCRRVAHFRPVRTRSRRTGTQAAIHQSRVLRREDHDDGNAAGAQPRRDQLQCRRRRRCQDRRHQHRRHAGIHRSDADQGNAVVDARMADLVHEERPVFQAEAAGRPRDAAQLLHQSRIPRVRRRLDAGFDHARQGRHLHHDQHHRRAQVHRLGCAARAATCCCPRRS